MVKANDEVRKKDPDLNRITQSDRAAEAYLKGYTKAIRHANVGACQWCLDHDGETIDIWEVIQKEADHYRGHCTFTFTKDEFDEDAEDEI
jgi:hypothetical protein